MAQYDDHIKQAKRNLVFLSNINNNITDCIDWQVTTCFYTAVHLVNAHLSKFALQYRNHTDVKDALNPENQLSLTKLPESEYIAYIKLQSLSRRSRYLVEEGDRNLNATQAFITYDKHLGKAIRHLNILIIYFSTKYTTEFDTINLRCDSLIHSELHYINKI